MKKIIALMLVVVLSALTLVACTPANNEKDYTLAVAVDFSAGSKLVNTAVAVVFDADNKIVDVRFDCAEVTPTVADGAVAAVSSIVTKVETGDAYAGMAAGSWAKQTKAFEDAIIGKTAAEVKDLDMTLVTGCTMVSTPATFKSLVEKAANSTNKVAFKAAGEFTLGLSIDGVINAKGQYNTDFSAVVVADEKILACNIDSNSVSLSVGEDGAIVAADYAGTKAEQGEKYTMPAGSWVKQSLAFTKAVTGLNKTELEAFEPVSDALATAGCTMQNTTAGYKASIIKAFGYAR